MNVILIIADTYRWDNLGCYGGTEVHTPNLDRLADESTIFENAYLTSFPTVPNRHDIMTGKCTYTYAGWEPLPEDAITLQDVLGSVGVFTTLIADTPHLIGRGFNYQRGFEAFEWIRGQENDHFRSFPRHVEPPCSPDKLRAPEYAVPHQARNSYTWRLESDQFVAQTMRKAEDWLEENAQEGPFFLWVDTFDPHEPWDAPQWYVDRYDPGYQGEAVAYPKPGPCDYLTPAELDHSRALYRAEATMVDHWVGRLLNRIDALGLRDDTAIIFTSDHGYLFGEHEMISKGIITEKGYESIPMYQDIVRTPLLIRMPGIDGGQRIPALVQSHDLMPTILELSGVIMTESVAGKANVQVLQCGMYKEEEWQFDPASLHGASLVPLMRGERTAIRDMAVSSHTLTVPSPIMAKCGILTDDGWCLFFSGEQGEAVGAAKVARDAVAQPEDAMSSFEPELFYLPDDPGQEHNVIDEHRDIAEAIHARYVAHLEAIGTEERLLKTRRRLFA